ncbi:hypothetical protein [Massilia scottii]|uniref:hypothetical protein n=1 Tax=Massilia scottii TaxID=3057166 RepID=UPI0027963D6E|nr:hypothetical protein [Massilia sp. CCM 9029]MDQ1833298.1 hypothetical protein [Massilia sp. CCM 9029]
MAPIQRIAGLAMHCRRNCAMREATARAPGVPDVPGTKLLDALERGARGAADDVLASMLRGVSRINVQAKAASSRRSGVRALDNVARGATFEVYP